MIKKCYRLMADKGVAEELGRKTGLGYAVRDYVEDIDEDHTSKRAYIAAAKAYTGDFNKKFNLNCTYQELFGEPQEMDWAYCTVCGASFPMSEAGEHDCD